MALRPDNAPRFVVGCMTGTSLDGLDAALVEIRGHGLNLTARFLELASAPLGPLAQQLAHLAAGGAASPLEFARTARALGELHANLIADLCSRHGLTPDLIAAHGQTIWHAPAEHLSVQLLDPWPIVRRLRAPVVYDLRQADLIAGGQGAPITPLADWILFRHPNRPRLLVNLGGICNVTSLPASCPPEAVRGEDIGPCNLLIDGVVRALFPGQSYDTDGRIASSGQPTHMMLELLLRSEFFSRPRPRTTGREDFSASWSAGLAAQAVAAMPPADVVASAVQAVAVLIARAAADFAQLLRTPQTHAPGPPKPAPISPETGPISPVSAKNLPKSPSTPNPALSSPFPARTPPISSPSLPQHSPSSPEILLAGGGAKNPALVAAIASALSELPGVSSADLGIPVDAREAVEMAILGALSQDGVPITLTPITGAASTGRAGSWVYP